MKRVFVFVAALAFCGGTALATDLNVSVESGGSNAIQVGPGAMVAYEVVGELSDDLNEGLALVTFDLSFTGGDLAQADLPDADPMLNFTLNAGITNPVTESNPNGYGGSMIGGELIQIGGAQNTINNFVDNAPFPIGTVITNVAQPGSPVVLASGTLMAPMEMGDYVLSLSNLLANVITDGETGDPFWAVEEAGMGTNTSLTITVGEGGCEIMALSSMPADGAIDARQPFEPDGSNPAGWTSIAITFDGDASCLTADDFTVSVDPAGPAPGIASVTADGNTATIEFDQTIPLEAWTMVMHNFSGVSFRIGNLPADVNNDGTSTANDVLELINHLNGVVNYEDYQTDVNRTGEANPQDVLRVIDLLNGAASYDVYLGATLPE